MVSKHTEDMMRRLNQMAEQHTAVVGRYDTVMAESAKLYSAGQRDAAVAMLIDYAMEAEPTIGPFDEKVGKLLSQIAEWCKEMENPRDEAVARDRANYIAGRLGRSEEQQIEDMRLRIAKPRLSTDVERKAAMDFIIQQLERGAPTSFTVSRDEENIEAVIRYRRAWYAFGSYGSLRGLTVCCVRQSRPEPKRAPGFWTQMNALWKTPERPAGQCVVIAVGKAKRDWPPIQYPLVKPFAPKDSSFYGCSNYTSPGTTIISMTDFNNIASDVKRGKYEVSEILVGGPFG